MCSSDLPEIDAYLKSGQVLAKTVIVPIGSNEQHGPTGLLGTDWTDQDGATRHLTAHDVIVVTPYNDQRRLITIVLQAQAATAGVEVGTVDKFQGQEAAVVLFSMTTSSSEFMPRTADFLFSKNRLNVAISRARALAYLICTDELLDTRARDVPQMTLISALCAFVERTPVLTAT